MQNKTPNKLSKKSSQLLAKKPAKNKLQTNFKNAEKSAPDKPASIAKTSEAKTPAKKSPLTAATSTQKPSFGRGPNKPQNMRPRSHHKKPEEVFSFADADDRVYDVFRNHDFGDYPHDQRHELVKFYQLLMTNQKVQNFTRLITLREVAIKHFIDCLMVPRLIKLEFPLLDMGTGPGFPGIPLKIHLPEDRIILAEGVQKRVEFLKSVRDHLNLKNLDIIGRYVNEDFVYPVQSVITRAVESAEASITNVMACLNVGGSLVLMKGPNCQHEIEPALAKWGKFVRLEKNTSYTLPKTSHERTLLVFRKFKAAPVVHQPQSQED
jgi:16S rRNA (guanine527-N7)-methyltransferase